MECKYVHVHSDLKTTGLRPNMHLFMTVTSKFCINKNIVGLSFIINFMGATPVSGIEREPWVAASILRRVNYGV